MAYCYDTAHIIFMLSMDRKQYLCYVLQIYCDKKVFPKLSFWRKRHLWIVIRGYSSFSLLAHPEQPNQNPTATTARHTSWARLGFGVGPVSTRTLGLQIRTQAPDPSRFYLAPQTRPNLPVSAAAPPPSGDAMVLEVSRAPCRRFSLGELRSWTNLLPWAWFSPAGDYDLHRQLGVDAERRLRAVAVPGAGWCGQPHLRRQDSGTNRPFRAVCPSRPVLRSDRSDFRSFVWVRVSGILDLIPSLCSVAAVEPGEHGRRHDDGRQGRPRACHSHQWPREDPRLYAR